MTKTANDLDRLRIRLTHGQPTTCWRESRNRKLRGLFKTNLSIGLFFLKEGDGKRKVERPDTRVSLKLSMENSVGHVIFRIRLITGLVLMSVCECFPMFSSLSFTGLIFLASSRRSVGY